MQVCPYLHLNKIESCKKGKKKKLFLRLSYGESESFHNVGFLSFFFSFYGRFCYKPLQVAFCFFYKQYWCAPRRHTRSNIAFIQLNSFSSLSSILYGVCELGVVPGIRPIENSISLSSGLEVVNLIRCTTDISSSFGLLACVSTTCAKYVVIRVGRIFLALLNWSLSLQVI